MPIDTPTFQLFLPWEFSPPVLIVALAALLLYQRGRRAGTGGGFWRGLAFWLGVLLLYASMQTYFDYYAQHLFFVHRLQHLVLHHLGPFLLALSAPQAALRAGLPAPARGAWDRFVAWAPVRIGLRVMLNPWVAALLFVGGIGIWLLPRLHFAAMLSLPLYQLMDWSMILDGVPFWWLVVDPQPAPPARLGFGGRILLLWGVMLPQILLGAYISLSRHDLYTVYALCGRALDLSPIVDQQIGGLIIWIPGAMMSVIASVIVLARLMANERGRRVG